MSAATDSKRNPRKAQEPVGERARLEARIADKSASATSSAHARLRLAELELREAAQFLAEADVRANEIVRLEPAPRGATYDHRIANAWREDVCARAGVPEAKARLEAAKAAVPVARRELRRAAGRDLAGIREKHMPEHRQAVEEALAAADVLVEALARADEIRGRSRREAHSALQHGGGFIGYLDPPDDLRDLHRWMSSARKFLKGNA